MSSKRPPRADRSGRGGSGGAHEDGTQLVPGERAVRELLEHAPRRIVRLVLERRPRLQSLHDVADAAGVAVQMVDASTMHRLSQGHDARGVLAIAKPRPLLDLDDLLPDATAPSDEPRRLWLALDGVSDPQNLGAILRSAEFFGVEGVFWPRDRAVGVTPTVVRASAGASERVPIAEVTNLARALDRFRDAGAWLLGTVVQDGTPLRQLQEPGVLPSRLVVVMGGEHAGLRRLTRERCDYLATIERRGKLASLNVAAATAVVLAAVC